MKLLLLFCTLALMVTGLYIADRFSYLGRLEHCYETVLQVYAGNEARAEAYCFKWVKP